MNTPITSCHPRQWGKLFDYKPNEAHRRLADRFNVLPYMVYRYEEIFGSIEEVVNFLSLGPRDILRSIRVNTLKTTVDAVKSILEEKGFILKRYWIPYTLIVEHEPFSIGATHEYLKGYYYIQGAGAQTPVYITDPKPLEYSIDMAAAPGGKTTQIAQHQRDTTPIVAIDKSKSRLAALKNNVNRLGVKSVIAMNMDARDAPRVLGTDVFDYVLLDAPCTGEGLLPLDPNRRRSRTPLDLADRACLQVQLLKAAIMLAKPGGRIVYTTCSIAPEENEYVVTRVLEEANGYVKLEAPDILPPGATPGITEFNGVRFAEDVKKCIRLHPHVTRTEGFTICVLRKVASYT